MNKRNQVRKGNSKKSASQQAGKAAVVPGKGRVRLKVKLSRAQYEAVCLAAAELGETRVEFIETAIREFIEGKPMKLRENLDQAPVAPEAVKRGKSNFQLVIPPPHKDFLCDSPEQASAYWRLMVEGSEFFNPDVECMIVVLLNTRRKVIGHQIAGIGTLDTVLTSSREVFRGAIKGAASAIVLFHNHPSGDATPSEADIRVTRDLIRAGQVLEIEVLDHLIMGHGRPKSLRELGYFEETRPDERSVNEASKSPKSTGRKTSGRGLFESMSELGSAISRAKGLLIVQSNEIGRLTSERKKDRLRKMVHDGVKTLSCDVANQLERGLERVFKLQWRMSKAAGTGGGK